MIRPGMQSYPYEVELSDGKGHRQYGLILDGDNAIQQSSLSEDQFAAYIRNVGKKFGDFDEQRDWKGGRGIEYFNDNPSGFWDSQNAWTLSSGHLIPTLQWKFAKDMRSCDFNMPGSVTWKALLGNDRYLDISFSASASYSAAHLWLWIRRIGKPGTLTVELCDDSTGDPGSVLKTMTVTTSTITDVISVLHDFEPSSVQALTASTTYHVKIYAGADTKASHWEVACDAATAGLQAPDGSTWTSTTYSPYYRVTDADVNRNWFMFMYDGSMYAVDSLDSGGNSTLYINGEKGVATAGTSTTLTDSNSGLRSTWTTNMWANAIVKITKGTGKGQIRTISSNTATALTVSTAFSITPSTDSEYVIYGTDRFVSIGSTGLGKVTACPISSGAVVYFPQGTTAMRRMRWNAATPGFDFAADSTNTADFLLMGYDATDGPQVWGFKNSDVTAQRADNKAWGTDLTFRTAIKIGDTHSPITGVCLHEGTVYIFKSDSVWSITGDRASEKPFGLRSTPDKANGAASASHNLFLYFSWLWSTERLYGGTLDDIGQDWSGPGLPDGRHGPVCKYEPAVGWLFSGIDAGTGTSSVLCWDGLGWHEVFQGFSAGRRVRNVKWQPCEEARHRLWTCIGGELVYQVFPLNTASPLRDSGVTYMHEAVLTSSVIDMGAASRLPKYIKGLTMVSKNMSDGGMLVDVEYQVDDDTSWHSVSPGFSISPEEEVSINEGDIRQFSYRLRLHTDTAATPVDIRAVVPNGFARVPWRKVWNLRVKAGQIFDKTGRQNVPMDELLSWLDDIARFPGRVRMTSIFPELHEKWVISAPVSVAPSGPAKGYLTVSLMEL